MLLWMAGVCTITSKRDVPRVPSVGRHKKTVELTLLLTTSLP